MMIELKTKRRWIVSILETVAEQPEGRLVARATAEFTSIRSQKRAETGLASRLKAATQSLADTGS